MTYAVLRYCFSRWYARCVQLTCMDLSMLLEALMYRAHAAGYQGCVSLSIASFCGVLHAECAGLAVIVSVGASWRSIHLSLLVSRRLHAVCCSDKEHALHGRVGSSCVTMRNMVDSGRAWWCYHLATAGPFSAFTGVRRGVVFEW